MQTSLQRVLLTVRRDFGITTVERVFFSIGFSYNCSFLTGFCLHVLEEHIGIVRCLQLFESRLVTGGDQKKLVVWDTQVRIARTF